jgi:hypothetical protein
LSKHQSNHDSPRIVLAEREPEEQHVRCADQRKDANEVHPRHVFPVRMTVVLRLVLGFGLHLRGG